LREKFHNKNLTKAMKLFSSIRILILILWLGAAVFFAFAVAPGIFAVLKSREVANVSEIAGALVSRNLKIINISGMIIGSVLLISAFFTSRGSNLFLIWLERFLLLVMTAACAVGEFVIGLWLQFVRNEIGRPIDELALDDPLRMKFNDLHEYSVWVLITAMIAALLSYFVISGKTFSAVSKEVNALDSQKDFKV
jgi:hypothetical protein